MSAKSGLGLRATQKIERRQAILSATSKLVAAAGIDDFTLEDIAREARMSVPTVYSYFASKNDILFSLFEADEALIEEKVRALLNDLPQDPCKALSAIESAAILGGYDITQKRLWREVSAAALRAADDRRSLFLALQNLRVTWLVEAIGELKGRGTIRKGVSGQDLALILNAIGRECFRRYVMEDHETIATLEERLERLFRLALAGAVTSPSDC